MNQQLTGCHFWHRTQKQQSPGDCRTFWPFPLGVSENWVTWPRAMANHLTSWASWDWPQPTTGTAGTVEVCLKKQVDWSFANIACRSLAAFHSASRLPRSPNNARWQRDCNRWHERERYGPFPDGWQLGDCYGGKVVNLSIWGCLKTIGFNAKRC